MTIHDFDIGPIELTGLNFQGNRVQSLGTRKGGPVPARSDWCRSRRAGNGLFRASARYGGTFTVSVAETGNVTFRKRQSPSLRPKWGALLPYSAGHTAPHDYHQPGNLSAQLLLASRPCRTRDTKVCEALAGRALEASAGCRAPKVGRAEAAALSRDCATRYLAIPQQ